MISIIVPIYNVATYLPQCLDSLIAQTYRDIEIICVNDGSTDNSLQILETYAQKDERIRVIDGKNEGISAARNKALEIAQGEWIMFVDSDDWIALDTCQSVLNVAHLFQADVVMWAYCREYNRQSLPKYYMTQQKTWDHQNISALHRRIVGPINEELAHPDTLDAYGTVWGKLYLRSQIEQPFALRFMDTKQIGSAEDVLFNTEYMARIQKAVYLPVAMYHYRKENGSFTSCYKPLLPQQWNRLYQIIAKILETQHTGSEFQVALNNRIALGLIGLGLNELFAENSFRETQKKIQLILQQPIYRKAINQLTMKYLPLHWHLFFFFAKHRFTIGITLLLKVIQKIIQR